VGIVLETPTQVLVVDSGLDAVVRVDLTNGTRTIVSDDTTPGPAFDFPVGIVLETPPQALVVDSGLPAVVRVDLTPGASAGTRTIVSDAATGSGPALNISFVSAPEGIAVEATGQLIVPSSSFIMRIDAITGDRAIISIGPGGIDRVVESGD
jgi:hypothetical protein